MKKQNQAAARACKPSPVQVRQDGYTFSGELAEQIQALAAERGVAPDAIVTEALKEFADNQGDDFRLPPKLAAKMDAEPEFEGCVPVQIQLPPELLQRARHHACHGSQYLSDWIRSLIELEDARARRLLSTHWED